MRKRKHKVVVEITLDKPCNAKQATTAVQILLEKPSIGRAVISSSTTKTLCKQFDRVFRAKRHIMRGYW